MKKIILSFLLVIFVTNGSFAQKQNISTSNNNGEVSISIQDSKQKLDLKVKGNITFTEDERGIQSLSHNGSLSYKKDRNKLKISQEKNGALLYVINGTKKTVPDAKDDALITECVNALINIGVNGKERAEKIYKVNGFDGVLKEVDRFESDYVKHIYLTALGSNPSLSDDEILSFLNKATTDLSSDYYKADLLSTIQEKYLNNEKISSKYLKTVEEINSDYYKAATLRKILRQPLTENQTEQVLEVVNTIASDYYKSDVLRSLISIKGKSEEDWSRLLHNSTKIASDYYKAEVFESIAATMPKTERLQMEFREAVKSIRSDYYYGSVMRAMRE